MGNNNVILSAVGDSNLPVDWWFIYKVAGNSTVSDGSKATGTEYVYFDSDKRNSKLHLSNFQISDPSNGAMSNTLNQIYNNAAHADLGWFFYNDENPITLKTNGTRGHTKGVLCFDLASDTAFWLISSAPKFPPPGKYSYPDNATQNAQTFLCITLENADAAKSIAAQMYLGQQPNVYLASPVPGQLKGLVNDPRVLLIGDQVTTANAPYGNFISFKSGAGMLFRSVAKNKQWNTPQGNDFYNDLVGPMLKESLDVETWEHGMEPGDLEGDGVHHIMAMKEVNLAPLGINPSYDWQEQNDHAKLVVSQPAELDHFVCVGDINFTKTMEQRSGGTVAFLNNDLWTAINEILVAVSTRPKKPGAAAKATQLM